MLLITGLHTHFDLMPNYIDLWESPTVKASGNKEEVYAINFLGWQK